MGAPGQPDADEPEDEQGKDAGDEVSQDELAAPSSPRERSVLACSRASRIGTAVVRNPELAEVM